MAQSVTRVKPNGLVQLKIRNGKRGGKERWARACPQCFSQGVARQVHANDLCYEHCSQQCTECLREQASGYTDVYRDGVCKTHDLPSCGQCISSEPKVKPAWANGLCQEHDRDREWWLHHAPAHSLHPDYDWLQEYLQSKYRHKQKIEF